MGLNLNFPRVILFLFVLSICATVLAQNAPPTKSASTATTRPATTSAGMTITILIKSVVDTIHDNKDVLLALFGAGGAGTIALQYLIKKYEARRQQHRARLATEKVKQKIDSARAIAPRRPGRSPQWSP